MTDRLKSESPLRLSASSRMLLRSCTPFEEWRQYAVAGILPSDGASPQPVRFTSDTINNAFAAKSAIMSTSVVDATTADVITGTAISQSAATAAATSSVTNTTTAAIPDIWLAFSGVGSHWAGMATQLMEIPIFATTMRRCDELLASRGCHVLLWATSQSLEVTRTLEDNPVAVFTSIVAVEVSLVELLRSSLNVQPTCVLGHSAGEVAAAYAAGALSLKAAMEIAYTLGDGCRAAPRNGALLAVDANWTDFAVQEGDEDGGARAGAGVGVVAGHKDQAGAAAVSTPPAAAATTTSRTVLPQGLYKACDTGPGAVTLGGTAEAARTFTQTRIASGQSPPIPINVSGVPYHTPLMAPAVAYMQERLTHA
eukprot:UC1_evm1s1952